MSLFHDEHCQLGLIWLCQPPGIQGHSYLGSLFASHNQHMCHSLACITLSAFESFLSVPNMSHIISHAHDAQTKQNVIAHTSFSSTLSRNPNPCAHHSKSSFFSFSCWCHWCVVHWEMMMAHWWRIMWQWDTSIAFMQRSNVMFYSMDLILGFITMSDGWLFVHRQVGDLWSTWELLSHHFIGIDTWISVKCTLGILKKRM